MYQLSDLYALIMNKELPSTCGIACERVDREMAILNRKITERCSLYSFNLVLRGWAKIRYHDRVLIIEKNDCFISTPGTEVYTLDVSEDYLGWCLMCDESPALTLPLARKIITASYYPIAISSGYKIRLPEKEAKLLARRLEEIFEYGLSSHFYKEDSLIVLFSIFILDLLNIEYDSLIPEKADLHSVDLFIRFLRLTNENFISHHDLGFYARQLAVSPIYLSRIVKRISAQTVKNHIDRLLIMDACFRLTSTSASISQIALDLNFANPASFCKFFVRHKHMSPRRYRNMGQ